MAFQWQYISDLFGKYDIFAVPRICPSSVLLDDACIPSSLFQRRHVRSSLEFAAGNVLAAALVIVMAAWLSCGLKLAYWENLGGGDAGWAVSGAAGD